MSETVAKRSKQVEAMLAASARGRTLMGGSAAMRAAGKTYLPKFPAESEESYSERLALSWLFNGYKKTVNDMVGRVFNRPIEIGDDVPPRIEEMLANVDLQGNDLSVFAREVFEDAISGAGIGFIMVDAPRREGTVTRAEAQSRNLRPYLTHIKLEELLGWKSDIIDNVPTLTQVRLMESVTDQDPTDEFTETQVEQVRVLTLDSGRVTVRIFRKAGKDDKWQEVPDLAGVTGLSAITLVPVYARRKGFMIGEPVLDDLAEVNVAHWQSQSDQRNILHVARVPILFGAGIPEDKTITVSTSSATLVSDPGAKLGWVEHSGQAIGAGRQDLKDLEFQMEAFGLQLVVSTPNQSATGETLDAKKETSQLSMMADALQDALEQALYFMCDYAGERRQGGLTVNKDFTVAPMSAQELTVLLSAVNTGNLSKHTFIAELVRRGVISETTPDDEADRISDEGGGMGDDTTQGGMM